MKKKSSGRGKKLLVGGGAIFLFYPTLIYNLLRNKIQPLQFRWWDQVTPCLLLGAVPFPKDVLKLKNLGVYGVITLSEPFETLVPPSLYQEHGIDHMVLPTRDYMYAPSFADINKAVDFIHNNASCGRKTYLHCKAGRGRSTTIAICYLVKHEGMTPGTALELIRSIRARVLLTSSQEEAVEEYYQYCLGVTENSAPIIAVPATEPELEGQNNTNIKLESTSTSLELEENNDAFRNGHRRKRPSCFNSPWTLSSGCTLFSRTS